MQNIGESRREWLLHKFEYAAHSRGRAENYKIWKDDNHAILVEGNRFKERLDYIHKNPVEQLIVANESDYLFSSAYDYTGKKGLVKVTIG